MVVKKSGLKQLPSREDHHCFGCGPINPYGLQMRFLTNGEATFSWVTVPDHLSGHKGLAHGGVITAILDEIMGAAAIYLLKCMILTKSITVDFVKPVKLGRELRAEARPAEKTHRRDIIVDGFLFDGARSLCARAKGTFAVLSPGAAEMLGMMDEATREFLDLINSL